MKLSKYRKMTDKTQLCTNFKSQKDFQLITDFNVGHVT